MFALIASYTAFIPYTGFLLIQVFRICGFISHAYGRDTFRLTFGLFNRNLSVGPNPIISPTLVGGQPKARVRSGLYLTLILGLSYCAHSRVKASKPGNSLIREITRAPPGKSSSKFISFPYKELPVRVISQFRFKSFLLSNQF